MHTKVQYNGTFYVCSSTLIFIQFLSFARGSAHLPLIDLPTITKLNRLLILPTMFMWIDNGSRWSDPKVNLIFYFRMLFSSRENPNLIFQNGYRPSQTSKTLRHFKKCTYCGEEMTGSVLQSHQKRCKFYSKYISEDFRWVIILINIPTYLSSYM